MIPFVNVGPLPTARVAKALETGMVGPGQMVADLENRLSIRAGRPCVCTVSGTVALQTICRVLGVVGNVAVPAFGVHSVLNAFRMEQLGLVPVDVGDDGCMLLDLPTDIVAMCYVRFGGLRGRIAGAELRSDRERFVLIEDASCAIHSCDPTVFKRGFASALSFSAPKPVTAGQGGAMFFEEMEDAEEARGIIDGGRGRRRGAVVEAGSNLRMTDVQAGLILDQLDRGPAGEEAKAILKASPHIRVFPMHNVLFAEDAGNVLEELRHCGIDAQQPYAPFWRHPAYANLGDPEEFPGARHWAEHAIFLPFGPGLTVDQAEEISDAVNACI